MTVAVAAGAVLVDNQAAQVTAGNVTITTADATIDRIDAIVADNTGAKSAIAGDLDETGVNVFPADSTGFSLLAHVYVFNQAHPEYTGAIEAEAVLDRRLFVLLDQPADTLAFTFDDSALSNTDPGATVFGFNSATIASVTKAYVSYTSFTASAHQWFIPSTGSSTPFTLRLWSRKNPANYLELEVTGLANHGTGGGTYCELTCSITKAATGLTTVQLSTDVADTIMEYIGAAAGVTATNGTAALGGDVGCATANTFADGPTTGSIGASGEVYLIQGHVTILCGSTGTRYTVKLWNGTTTISEGELQFAANTIGTVHLSGIRTFGGAETWKLSAAPLASTTGGLNKAAAVDNSAGNFASRISYVRIA